MTEKKKRDARHYLRRFLISGFLCFLIMVILYANLPELRKAWWQWQLNQAQKKWEENEPAHYRYTWCSSGQCLFTVTVENGQVVEAFEWRYYYTPSDGAETMPPLPVKDRLEDLNRVNKVTIEARFQFIQNNLDYFEPLRIEYDRDYGYPKVVIQHFCVIAGVNPISGFCEPINFTDHIADFEVLQEE